MLKTKQGDVDEALKGACLLTDHGMHGPKDQYSGTTLIIAYWKFLENLVANQQSAQE
jgi:hypothetical protein